MKHKHSGLTLVELMIILAILAIVSQIALPAWQQFIAKQRSQALQNSLERSVFQARSLAISQRIRIELCGSTDGESCSTNWSKGWIIRRYERNSSEPEIIARHEQDPRHLQLNWSGFQPKILYHPGGLSTASNGRFYVCREQSIDWQLILNRQGRLRRARPQENREADSRCHG